MTSYAKNAIEMPVWHQCSHCSLCAWCHKKRRNFHYCWYGTRLRWLTILHKRHLCLLAPSDNYIRHKMCKIIKCRVVQGPILKLCRIERLLIHADMKFDVFVDWGRQSFSELSFVWLHIIRGKTWAMYISRCRVVNSLKFLTQSEFVYVKDELIHI